jgi:SAM-dependent methyltransferase
MRRPILLLSLCVLAAAASAAPPAAPKAPAAPRYEYRVEHDPDGTGKFYMGREIAQVVGPGASIWLDRPEREAEEAPSRLIELLKLRPGDVVADVGAGSGYLSLPMAQRVGPKGKVLAVDIQPELLEIIRKKTKEQGIPNVQTVLGSIEDPRLPANSVDLILMVDVYHEFSHPWEMTRGMVRALKPGGRLVFVEYRKEDPSIPIKLVHKMTEEQVRKEMSIHPLRWVETLRSLPRQHVIVFRKGAPKGKDSP